MVLHALSLARIALLAATDHVATSVRLDHELAMLREELRIKDARVELHPPRRRGAVALRRLGQRPAPAR